VEAVFSFVAYKFLSLTIASRSSRVYAVLTSNQPFKAVLCGLANVRYHTVTIVSGLLVWAHTMLSFQVAH